MEKINEFSYKSKGIIISFKEVRPTDGQLATKYCFFVEGNQELTDKLLSSVKQKKISRKSIFFCALALFEKIEGNTSKNVGKITISSSSVKKGSAGEEYYKINLIHQQKGGLNKTFVLYGGEPFGTKEDFKDLFYSGQGKKYQDFLTQFGIEIPEELLTNSVEEYEDVLEKFSLNFTFI